MTLVAQQLGTRPVAPEPEAIAEFLNRELVPVVRRLRAVVNEAEGSLSSIYAVTFGDGVASTYDISHPFGTKDVMIEVFDNPTGTTVNPAVLRLDDNTIRVSIGFVATVDRYRLLVRA